MRSKIKLIITLFLGSFLTLIVNVNAEENNFIIGNNKLNSSNKIITDSDDGRAIWNSETKTLVLENFDYNGAGVLVEKDDAPLTSFYTLFGILDEDEVNIVLKGKNTFKYVDGSFANKENIFEIIAYFDGNVNFDGPGEINFITSNDDNIAMLIGLATFNNLSVKNGATINVETYKSLGETNCVFAANDLNMVDGNIFVNAHDNSLSYGVTVNGSINMDSSMIDVNMQSGDDLTGIETDAIHAKESIIKVNVGPVSEDAVAISSEDITDLENSKLFIMSTDTGIITDEFVAEKSDIEIAADTEAFRSGLVADLSSYNPDHIWVNTYPFFLGVTTWDGETPLSDYKYLRIAILQENGEKLTNLENESIKLITDDIYKLFDFNEVDKFRMGYKLNSIINIETDDDYELYDLDLVNSNLGEYKLGKIIDISLTKKIGPNGRNLKLTNLSNNVKINYKLENSLIGDSNRIYKMLRVHNGKVNILDASLNLNTNELMFETDCFSTYAILYKDIEKEEKQEEINIENPVQEDNPKTVDTITSSVICLILSVICIALALIIYKIKFGKRKRS